jgi:Fur family ferric uptake transcriptional regulator
MQRDTRQRRALREIILTEGRPLSPTELLELSQRIVPNLGLATVYRNIRMLMEEGFLREVHIAGDAPRYEQAGTGHHHHFYCFRCGKVTEINGCRSEVNTLVPEGFLQDFHELTFYGSCATCNASNSQP